MSDLVAYVIIYLFISFFLIGMFAGEAKKLDGSFSVKFLGLLIFGLCWPAAIAVRLGMELSKMLEDGKN